MNTTAETYRDVPPPQRDRLFAFRVTHPYTQLTINGASWQYIACGQGDSALLFLPGAFLQADMWFNQILALETDHRIIAPNAYALQGLFDFDAVCDALVQTLDAEGIERAIVVGLSAGGGVAQLLLQTHPERVEHAVFSHRGVLELSPEAESRTRRILGLVRILPLFVIRRVLKRMTTGEPPSSSRWTAFHEAYVQEAIRNVDKPTVVRFLRSGLETRRQFTFEPEILESWSGSILILSSRDDALSRPSVEKLQVRYPRAMTEFFKEGGHHAFLFLPDTYTAALRRFLEGESPVPLRAPSRAGS
jgi:lipase